MQRAQGYSFASNVQILQKNAETVANSESQVEVLTYAHLEWLLISTRDGAVAMLFFPEPAQEPDFVEEGTKAKNLKLGNEIPVSEYETLLRARQLFIDGTKHGGDSCRSAGSFAISSLSAFELAQGRWSNLEHEADDTAKKQH